METVVDRAGKKKRPPRRNGKLLVALPEPNRSMTQDEEWCVVHVDGAWRQVRFHDYEELFSIPGLYEKVIYDILGCDSPRVVRRLLEAELLESGERPDNLRVLDLGAGNGMVGEELSKMGVELTVGVDIIEEAAEATQRDRPGVYDSYHVVDMSVLSEAQRRRLGDYRFNALTCVAALGFNDIPPRVFTAAFELIRPGGWVAFNVKEDFLSNGDRSGFAGLVHKMLERGALDLRQRERYRHRLGTNRRPLHYVTFVGRKRADLS